MYNRDYRDIAGGAMIAMIGIVASYMAITGMNIGNLGRIGPGMFPVIIGVLLTIIGIFILVPGFVRSGGVIHLNIRPLLFVTASMILFGLTIEPLGIVPSVIIVVVVASLADPKSTALGVAINAAVLAALAVVIFKMGFGIAVPVISLPW